MRRLLHERDDARDVWCRHGRAARDRVVGLVLRVDDTDLAGRPVGNGGQGARGAAHRDDVVARRCHSRPPERAARYAARGEERHVAVVVRTGHADGVGVDAERVQGVGARSVVAGAEHD